MSDFLELAAKRYSCRNFSDKPVERDKLEKCLEAARLAPSGCNAQPWKFVMVVDPKTLEEVAKTTQQLGLNEHTSKAKAILVILEDHAKLMPKVAPLLDSQVFAKGDLGGAALSFCLEAESLGLGTCMLGLFDRPKLSELLDLPLDQRYFLLVAVGYPAKERDEARSKPRKPFNEIARFV
ncbi:MAG: nitroreductase family protein [Deltaproteobacteria bacterium]|jgi:nitroreductase|nr:nitroreductase family protein [Deltaproteobacteria bacterium]